MNEFLTWFGDQKPAFLWTIFILSSIVLTLVPFYSRILKYLLVHLSNVKPQIVDFSWRLSPDTKIAESDIRAFYLSRSVTPILFKGMSIQLCWHVEGAFRIDVHPIGHNLVGNFLSVVLQKGDNNFRLVAHTPKGLLTKEISIHSADIRTIQTATYGTDNSFDQPRVRVGSDQLSAHPVLNHPFSGDGVANLKKVIVSKQVGNTREMVPDTSSLSYLGRFQALSKSIANRKTFTYTFQPHAYFSSLNEKPLNLND